MKFLRFPIFRIFFRLYAFSSHPPINGYIVLRQTVRTDCVFFNQHFTTFKQLRRFHLFPGLIHFCSVFGLARMFEKFSIIRVIKLAIFFIVFTDLPQCPNVDQFNYESMKSTLLERLELFHAAPFTVQRLCELLTDPKKHYTRLDKFMRALEKNILGE